jgi:hypothetical protein
MAPTGMDGNSFLWFKTCDFFVFWPNWPFYSNLDYFNILNSTSAVRSMFFKIIQSQKENVEKEIVEKKIRRERER